MTCDIMDYRRHLIFQDLKRWGNRMRESYEEHNAKMVEYYEGMIAGTIVTMQSMAIISFNTYWMLDNMLTKKRAELRGEFELC